MRFHERAGKEITNFAATMPRADSDLAQQATRDPCLFDFVGNADIRRERDLEQGLVDHVGKFLLELGQGSPSSAAKCDWRSETTSSSATCSSTT